MTAIMTRTGSDLGEVATKISPKILGFTGTRQGMSAQQNISINLLTMGQYTEIHHGDCVGADEAMDLIAENNGIRRVIHPPLDSKLRAYCKGDIILLPKEYLARNRAIVKACDTLIGCPAETSPQNRSGTWYTIRHAIKIGLQVIVVWPDGTTWVT